MRALSLKLRKSSTITLMAVICVLGLGLAFAVQAQDTSGLTVAGTGIEYGAYTGLSGTDIRITIANIIRIALGLLGIIALLLILYGGFLWMTAAGSDERIASAKKTLTAAVIGLVIIITSFAIVSFVMNSLISATGGDAGGGGFGGGGGPGGGGFGGGGSGFRPLAIQPSGSVGKRDVAVMITFSSAPTGDISNIQANIKLEKDEGGTRTDVAYSPVVQNNTIRLISDAPCPAPNEDKGCLDASSDFVVNVLAGLKNASTSNPITVNCGFTAVCSQDFSTGDAVGTEPPTVVITDPTDGQSVQEGSLVQIQTLLGDEYGIGSVEYFADGAFFTADGSVTTLSPGSYSSQTFWDNSGIVPVRTVRLKARALNIDGDQAESPEVSVVVRPAHCFNGATDADETGADCGGADCGACTGGSCTTGADCASGECIGGQCVVSPKITDVQLRDGAPGNLVTITGANFGGGTGTVVFLGNPGDDTDDVTAPLANCSGAWSDERVVISVPNGSASGPIELRTATGKTDATNDTFGSIIPNFQVNDVSRPGICGIDPNSAKTGQIITLTGEGFGDAQGASRVQFAQASFECLQAQSFADGADAGAVSPWSAVSVQPTVPNVSSGLNGMKYLVRVTAGGEPSNPVCMQVLPPEAGTAPFIASVSPTDGSVGTYVTLLGTNFGAFGTVRFTNDAGMAVGDVNFPEQCGTGFWESGSVTVKVPAKFTTPAGTSVALAGYQVTVLRSDGRESNSVSFTINNDPLTPGLCRIKPTNGPAGTPVTLFGEGFGEVPFGDLTGLALDHPDSVLFYNRQSIGNISLWNDTSIGTSATSTAETGPVSVRVYSGQDFVESNGVNFEVRDCRESGGDASCESGFSCCGDGSCRTDCDTSANVGGFAWQFSTGPIPVFPVVLEDATCQATAPTTMPSPNPFRNRTGVCTNIDAIALRFSLPMDNDTFTSESVVLEKCGGGRTASSSGTCEVAPVGALSLGTYDTEGRTLFTLSLSGAGLSASEWYKLTITDAVMSEGTFERPAGQLDGDFDARGGGNYVTVFKTGDTPCELSAVDVQPSRGLIEASSDTLEYTAFPLSNRCIVLSCDGRDVSWESSDTSKATIAPSGGTGQCKTDASPVDETVPGPDIQINAVVDTKEDEGDLKVDYANPRVVEYGPRDCDVACINGLPFAYFNTDMAESEQGNILTNAQLYECATESCVDLQEVATTLKYEEDSKMLVFDHLGLVSNTFYRAVIKGTAESTSRARLTGLNYNNEDFSWIFRTRAGNNVCGVQRVGIVPVQTTLRYIGQLKEVNAQPFSSPDKCSATGQLLSTTSFNWNWEKSQSISKPPEVFTLLPNFPTILNTSPVLPDGCTSVCLASGSEPPGTPECGNGILEFGEACDTPDENGCNSSCLMKGNTIANGCGDNNTEQDKGEECDAGTENGKDGSGCTELCLLTGSVPGLSKCGNGSAGVGEACDDGNNDNFDGCSAVCTWEGSRQDVAVCGNGVIELPYEQCDYKLSGSSATALFLPTAEIALGPDDERDPSSPSFACSSSCLLRGNTVRGATGDDVCGNGKIDPAMGEACDSGPDNGNLGSGCSRTCTRTGEDIVLGAFCGDGNPPTTKLLADGIANGGGEDCDTDLVDDKADPRQVVKALNQCDAKNDCDGTVKASVSAVSGEGNVNVECSCISDSDCAVFNDGPGSDLACGAGACCFQRPAPPNIEPTGFDKCRNAAITIRFFEEMNTGSLTGNIVVEQCGAVVKSDTSGNIFVRAVRAVGNFFKSLVGAGASAAGDCSPIEGSFRHYKVPGEAVGSSVTESGFIPNEVLLPETEYRVTVTTGSGGVRSVSGVGYPELPKITQSFGTGEEICSFDVLQVDPPTFLIQSSSETPGFNATAMTQRGGLLKPIGPVPGVYDWSWDWAVAPVDGAESQLTLTKNDLVPETVTVQANKGVQGTEQLFATATITNDTIFSPSTVDDKRIGKSVITTFLCENPWPRRDMFTGEWSPYLDEATHFETFYCRDSSDGQLLPELMESPVQGKSGTGTGLLSFCGITEDGSGQPKSCSSDSDCASGDACLAKDLFLLFQSESKLTDAVGIRIAPNTDHLAPQSWYEDQQFSGSTESLEVDGYNAIKDARTMYISAADKYGDPQLRSYMYVLGFNEGSSARTINIFDQLIANMNFNTNLVGSDDITNVCKKRVKDSADEIIEADNESGIYSCSSDLDCLRDVPNADENVFCDAKKDKLRRDMKRWEQLNSMVTELDAIRENSGFYPKLESGSFIRGMTTSKWPSWSQLGGASLSDPLNQFNQCDKFGSECSVTRGACSTDGDCSEEISGDVCEPKYEAETCFNNQAEIFMCPGGSRVYRYEAIGGVDYRLQAEFEYLEFPWGGACGDQNFESSCKNRLGCFWDAGADLCKSRVEISPSCRGVFKGNKCLASGAECADDSECDPGDSCQPFDVALFGTGAETCGNGLREGSEECEIGWEQTPACGSGGFSKDVCTTDCRWQEVSSCPGDPFCGNGVSEFGESCDDGALNGEYGRCRIGDTFGCGKYCVNTEKRGSFSAPNDIGPDCVTNAECSSFATSDGLPKSGVCTDRMKFCGDGIKNGPESCDDGAENGDYGKCAWDCSGPGSRCGDFTVNGSEQCDGDQSVSSGVCVAGLLADSGTAPGDAASCSSDSDCASGDTCALCSPTVDEGLPQTRTKNCNGAASPDACTFGNWSSCKPSGACGNGTVEGFEQCDNGSANSDTGACLTTCKLNVCNDGFLNASVEQCDNGALNGTECSPSYGLTCNYCKNDCTIETISGAFCGDSIIQKPPSGPESCDLGPVAAWCSKTYTDLDDVSGVVTCNSSADCQTGFCRYYSEVDAEAAGYDSVAFAPDAGQPGLFGQLEYVASNVGRKATSFIADLVSHSMFIPKNLGRLAFCPDPAGCFSDSSGASGTPPTIDSIMITPTSLVAGSKFNIFALKVQDEDDLLSEIRILWASQGEGSPETLVMKCSAAPSSLEQFCAAVNITLPAGDYIAIVKAVNALGGIFEKNLNFTVGSGGSGSGSGSSSSYDPTLIDGTPPGYRKYPRSGGGTDAPPVPCWSGNDCSSNQYCDGGEGQCVSYSSSCDPGQYSNTSAAPDASNYISGDCNECSSSCSGAAKNSPLFCGDLITQYAFGEECDGSGNPVATGNGTTYVCRNDCTYDPDGGFCGDGIVQADAGELCDGGLKGCETLEYDNPNLYTKVDMIFAVDISLSMQDTIDDISTAIGEFVNTYIDTDHQFGLVTFGQSNSSSLETYDDGSLKGLVTQLTDVANFQSKLSFLDADGGAIEPMYDSAYELASPTNKYDINWRSDAHPYIVVVSDEPPPAGAGSSSPPWKSESEVAARVGNCAIGECTSGSGQRVETFVIAKLDDYDEWNSIIYNEQSRFIELQDGGGNADYYVSQLGGKVFTNVCEVATSSGSGGG